MDDPRTWLPRAWLSGIVATTLSISGAAIAPAVAEVNPAQARALTGLVRNDCGSCHGMSLAGGLGPALTPAALAGRSIDGISWIIANGRAERAMPGWAPLLPDEEIHWIARGLLDGRFLTRGSP